MSAKKNASSSSSSCRRFHPLKALAKRRLVLGTHPLPQVPDGQALKFGPHFERQLDLLAREVAHKGAAPGRDRQQSLGLKPEQASRNGPRLTPSWRARSPSIIRSRGADWPVYNALLMYSSTLALGETLRLLPLPREFTDAIFCSRTSGMKFPPSTLRGNSSIRLFTAT